MPTERIDQLLLEELKAMDATGTRKGRESVITAILPAQGDRGPRYLLEGEGERPFLRMNSNGYLGMALKGEVMAAEEAAAREFGSGPGAVRFISGTWRPHVELV